MDKPSAAILLTIVVAGCCLEPSASASVWQWDNPLPQGNELTAVWGSGPSDVFAVGWWGTIVHYDGHKWALMESGTHLPLLGVWGSSAADVFAVGGSQSLYSPGGGPGPATILHYDGHVWSPMDTGVARGVSGLRGVWGSSGSDVYAVGNFGVLHYDGRSWSVVNLGAGISPPNAYGVWGSNSDDVFVVGDGDTLHFDGSRWSEMENLSGVLTDVWGSSGHDVFAVGHYGMIVHYDGHSWSQIPTGAQSVSLDGVWGTSRSNVFAVGDGGRILHYDGTSWSRLDTGSSLPNYLPLTGVWGAGGSDVYAVGDAGQILHYDGRAWSAASALILPLFGVWGASASDLFAVGWAGEILHRENQSWAPMNSGVSSVLRGVWGSGGSDVFAVGDTPPTILHYDGHSWSAMTAPASAFRGVWGSAGDDVYAAGEAGVLHYDGVTWSWMTCPCFALYAVWGSGAGDVFAVGDTGIFHYDGRVWTSMLGSPGSYLRGVWGTNGSDVFAVGLTGTRLHYDGHSWSVVANDSFFGDLLAVWGRSGRDVFAVGGGPLWGTVLHYDGSNWSVAMEGGESLQGVWGTNVGDAIAVGDRGAILRNSQGCVSGDTTLCLNGSRFDVEATWRTPDGQSGTGHAVPLTDDTGYFWFFQDTNVELVTKALNACSATSPRFWFFAGGLTDVETTVTVRDSVTGQVRTYNNPANTPFRPIQDTNAFATCGASGTSTAPVSRAADHATSADHDVTPLLQGAGAIAGASCTPSSTALCLGDGRFRVEATYRTAQGQSGDAKVVQLTPDTGYLWFFDASNVEAVVKVLDGCPVDERFWVFAGGLTNVEVDVRVTDTTNGTVKTYRNPMGTKFAPIQDTRAFATCP